MKQLVILSGKGGTGKTSVAAAFAHLAAISNSSIRTVLADADVDASNLELILKPQLLEDHEFIGGKTAVIIDDLCSYCGVCKDVCRFDAIHVLSGKYEVNPLSCEGCAACFYQCPEEAIKMEPQLAGHWFHSDSRHGPLFHAALRPGQENSGKLVMKVKHEARSFAVDQECDLMIVDGPPGIGCPVISAVSGADLALIVVEPSIAGVHDMQRVLETVNHFDIRSLVCINKADIFLEGADAIRKYCKEKGVDIVGNIPFDSTVTDAMVNGKAITEYDPNAHASQAMREIWSEIKAQLNLLIVEIE